MAEISLTAGILSIVTGWILVRLTVWQKSRRFDWKREAVQLLFLVNLLVIYRMTFHPFAKVNGHVQPLLFDPATVWPLRVNFIPFVNLLDYEVKSELIINLAGNVTMFIPTGIMVPLIYRRSFKQTVLTGFLLSAAIEVIQLPFSVRASDVDDLILNTAGCFIGYGIYALFRKLRACR